MISDESARRRKMRVTYGGSMIMWSFLWWSWYNPPLKPIKMNPIPSWSTFPPHIMRWAIIGGVLQFCGIGNCINPPEWTNASCVAAYMNHWSVDLVLWGLSVKRYGSTSSYPRRPLRGQSWPNGAVQCNHCLHGPKATTSVVSDSGSTWKEPWQSCCASSCFFLFASVIE